MGIGTSLASGGSSELEATKAELQRRLPHQQLTDADYNYWANNGGVDAVKATFPDQSAGDSWQEWQGRLYGTTQTGNTDLAKQVWANYGSTTDPSKLQEAMRSANVSAVDLATVAGTDAASMSGFLGQTLSPGYTSFKPLSAFSEPAPSMNGASFGAQTSQPSQSGGAASSSASSASQPTAQSTSQPATQTPPSSGGLINSVVTAPSYQSTRPNTFVPATPAPPKLVTVNENRTSLPQMNANAASVISGLPINQSRFANAGQPSGMLYQTNANYLSDIDLQRTLTPQDYISRFGVKV